MYRLFGGKFSSRFFNYSRVTSSFTLWYLFICEFPLQARLKKKVFLLVVNVEILEQPDALYEVCKYCLIVKGKFEHVRQPGTLRLLTTSSLLCVLPSACSIATDGIAVSKAFSTAPDSTTGEIRENSLSCIKAQYTPSTTVSLPGFGLNRTVLRQRQVVHM